LVTDWEIELNFIFKNASHIDSYFRQRKIHKRFKEMQVLLILFYSNFSEEMTEVGKYENLRHVVSVFFKTFKVRIDMPEPETTIESEKCLAC
jgi:hypothetical protein